MSDDFIAQEKERFNSLSQDGARELAKKADGAAPALRSCWYCNGSHEHLKKWDYFTCFSCGISYVFGFPTPILGMRMRGEEITDETMKEFVAALEDAE